MDAVRIAIAASPREWAGRLHRHVADHGGALVRATVLHPQDALDEDIQVFIADDSTSYLTRALVDELHRRQRAVLGVFDPDDPRSKGDLVELGVDEVIERGAPPEAFVAVLAALAAERREQATFAALTADLVDDEPAQRAPGRVVVVAGAAGGVGATEVAVGLVARAGRRGARCVLIDADEVAPCVAQRLGLAPYPNLRVAVEAVNRSTPLAAVPATLPGLPVAVLPGLGSGQDWQQVRPVEVLDVVRGLAALAGQAVVNIGHRFEDLHGAGGPPRYGVSRALLGIADVVVGVGTATPVGIARLLDWVATARLLVTPRARLHLVCAQAPASAFVRAEVAAELGRVCGYDGLWFLPNDGRVAAAAWAGDLVARGPFTKAVGTLADAVLCAPPPGRAPRRARSPRRAGVTPAPTSGARGAR